MTLRRALFILTVVCAVWQTATGYDVPATYRQRFGDRHLTPVEGIWLWNSGALVAIESDGHGAVKVTLLESNDPVIETPQVLGSGTFGGRHDTYNLELKTSANACGKSQSGKTAKFVADLSTPGRLTLRPYSTGLKVNAWRLLPYLFRFSVSRDKAPDGIEGAIRVWPDNGSPEFPIEL